MSQEGIKAILFDLGNVLLDFDYNLSAKRISNFCDKNPGDIVAFFMGSKETALFEEGKLSGKDFFTAAKEALGLNLSYEIFVPIWNEIFFLSVKNRAVYSLINTLNASYKVALISNIDELHLSYIKQNFPVFNVFHKLFFSCEVGVAKPGRLIYQKALDALEVRPENAFYTDDRNDLVISARDMGIKGFVFSDFTRLKDDLANCSVIIN